MQEVRDEAKTYAAGWSAERKVRGLSILAMICINSHSCAQSLYSLEKEVYDLF